MTGRAVRRHRQDVNNDKDTRNTLHMPFRRHDTAKLRPVYLSHGFEKRVPIDQLQIIAVDSGYSGLVSAGAMLTGKARLADALHTREKFRAARYLSGLWRLSILLVL